MELPPAIEDLPEGGCAWLHACNVWERCVEVRSFCGLPPPGDHEGELAARYGVLVDQAKRMLEKTDEAIARGALDPLGKSASAYRNLHNSAKELEARLTTRTRGRPAKDSKTKEETPNPYAEKGKLRAVK